MTRSDAVLQGFLSPLDKSPVVAELCRRLAEQNHAAATGQWGSCAIALAAIVQKKLNRPLLILTAHLDEADDAADQLLFFRPGSDARRAGGAADDAVSSDGTRVGWPSGRPSSDATRAAAGTAGPHGPGLTV